MYAGIRVGRVTDIRIDPDNVEQIRVTIEVESGTIIKTDAVAGIDTNILSGVSSIQIRGGTKDAPVLVAKEGERYPIIESRRSQLERVYSRLPRLLERRDWKVSDIPLSASHRCARSRSAPAALMNSTIGTPSMNSVVSTHSVECES